METLTLCVWCETHEPYIHNGENNIRHFDPKKQQFLHKSETGLIFFVTLHSFGNDFVFNWSDYTNLSLWRFLYNFVSGVRREKTKESVSKICSSNQSEILWTQISDTVGVSSKCRILFVVFKQ